MDARNEINIFISCPEDVSEEALWMVKAIKEAEAKFPDFKIKCFCWADKASLQSFPVTKDGQQHIDDQSLASKSDIFYALFGNRFGNPGFKTRRHKNPLPGRDNDFLSGTEYEIFDALTGYRSSRHQKPHISIFRIDKQPDPRIIENVDMMDQLKRVYIYLNSELLQVKSILGIDPGARTCPVNTYTFSTFQKIFPGQLEQDIQSAIQKQVSGSKKKKAKVKPPTEDLITYLEKLISDNRLLEMTGFGQLSKNPNVELEQVFVALKADQTQSYEIQQTQELHRLLQEQQIKGFSSLSGIEKERIVRNDLEALGYPQLSTFSNPRGKSYNFDELIREIRWSMILGDPGSGKTTLVRWLTLKMAMACLNNIGQKKELNFCVPKKQVDPDSGSEELTDMGKPRLPILIQIADYARWADKQLSGSQAEYSIWDYLGSHKGPRGGHFVNHEDKIKNLLAQAIADSHAMVILDGMDEIPQTLKYVSRQMIAEQIRSFKEQYLERFNQQNHVGTTSPKESAGNQLLVTSRITGYEAAVIPDLSHFIVQPMSRHAVEHFCSLWVKAVDDQRNHKRKAASKTQFIQSQSERLIGAIYGHRHHNIRELASNPLLLTVIALVFQGSRTDGGKLPQSLPGRRVELYQQALEILIHDWKDTDLDSGQFIRLLGPLATYIHTHYPDGCIDGHQLKEQLRIGLHNEKKTLDPVAIDAEAEILFQKIQDNIGLVYPRGNNLFAFLHLTFQEYLAGLELLRDPKLWDQKLNEHILDPRWREPILLAIGYKAWRSKDEINLLLDTVLKSDSEIGYLIPQGVFTILSALPELEGADENTIRQLIDILFRSYARIVTDDFEAIKFRIENSLLELKSHQTAAAYFDAAVIAAIRDPELAAPTCMLVSRLQYMTAGVIKSLIANQHHDSKKLGWPILNCLMTLANCPVPPLRCLEPKPLTGNERESLKEMPDELEKIERYIEFQQQAYAHQQKIEQQSQLDRSALDDLPVKQLFERKPELITHVTGDMFLLKLITTFYGGYIYSKKQEVEIEYAYIAAFLQKPQAERERLIDEDPGKFVMYSSSRDDVAYLMAFYLDKNMPVAGVSRRQGGNANFSTDGLFRDSLLTPYIYNLLCGAKSLAEISAQLREIWLNPIGENQELKADIYLFFLLKGEDHILQLDELHSQITPIIIAKLESLSRQVQDAVARNRDAIWESLKLAVKPDLYGIDTLLAFREIAIQSSPVPIVLSEYVPQQQVTGINIHIDTGGSLAEIQEVDKWIVNFFGGYGGLPPVEDITEKVATVLASLPPTKAFVAALHTAALSPLYQKYKHDLNWPLIHLAPRLSTVRKDDISPEALANLDNLDIRHVSENLHWELKLEAFRRFYEIADENPELEGVVDICISPLFFFGGMIGVEGNSETDGRFTRGLKKIKNPYYKAQALYHLYALNEQGFSLNPKRQEELFRTIRAIADAHEQVRIWELCFSLIDPAAHESIMDEIGKRISEIEDVENRARSYGRLGTLTVSADRWFTRAIDTAALISEEQRKSQTFSEIRLVIPPGEDLHTAFENAVNTLSDPWLRAKARGQLADELSNHPPGAVKTFINAEPELWAPLLISGTVSRALKTIVPEDDLETNWKLFGQNQDETAYKRIYQAGLKAGRLQLTFNAAMAIESLMEGLTVKPVHLQKIQEIFPLLAGATQQTRMLLIRWQENLDTFVAAHAHLLMLESGKKTGVSDLAPLVNLLSSESDLSRLRAYLALSSNVWEVTKTRFMKASQLGKGMIDKIGQLLADTKNSDHNRRLALFSFLGNVIFDDARMIAEWAATGSPTDIQILGAMEMVSAELLDEFYRIYCTAVSEQVKSTIFSAFCKMAETVSEYSNTLTKYEFDAPGHHYGEFFNCLKNYLYDFDKYPFATLDKQRINIKNLLFGQHGEFGKNIVHDLKSIGKTFYRQLSGKDEDAEHLARVIMEESAVSAPEKLTGFIYDWLLEELEDKEQDLELQGYLIRILAEIARLSPNTFIVKNSAAPITGKLLTQFRNYKSFWARRGCIVLIGSLRAIDSSILKLYLDQSREDRDIWIATIGAINKIAFLPQGGLDMLLKQLFAELNNISAIRAYFASRLLVAFGKNNQTNTVQKRAILSALTKASQSTSSNRNVYIFRGIGDIYDPVKIESLITLEKAFKTAVIEVTGLS